MSPAQHELLRLLGVEYRLHPRLNLAADCAAVAFACYLLARWWQRLYVPKRAYGKKD